MRVRRGNHRRLISLIAAAGASIALPPAAIAQSATRDLSDYAVPGMTFTVAIALDVPGGTNVVGVEDEPPTGWSVGTISDSGTFDAQTGRVKWLFLTPPIPTSLTYELTPPPPAPTLACFVGTFSYDELEEPIEGDDCVSLSIPAASGWSLAVLALILLVAGSLRVRRASHSAVRVALE